MEHLKNILAINQSLSNHIWEGDFIFQPEKKMQTASGKWDFDRQSKQNTYGLIEIQDEVQQEGMTLLQVQRSSRNPSHKVDEFSHPIH